MRRGYVDSSVFVALAFEEEGAGELRELLRSFGKLFASPLLEAEVAAALRREGVDSDVESLLAVVDFLHPHRRLTSEIAAADAAGPLRGADLFHVANALFAAPNRGICFLSLDTKQREVARRLGFEVVPRTA